MMYDALRKSGWIHESQRKHVVVLTLLIGSGHVMATASYWLAVEPHQCETLFRLPTAIESIALCQKSLTHFFTDLTPFQ